MRLRDALHTKSIAACDRKLGEKQVLWSQLPSWQTPKNTLAWQLKYEEELGV
jgi:hypothetical protein